MRLDLRRVQWELLVRKVFVVWSAKLVQSFQIFQWYLSLISHWSVGPTLHLIPKVLEVGSKAGVHSSQQSTGIKVPGLRATAQSSSESKFPWILSSGHAKVNSCHRYHGWVLHGALSTEFVDEMSVSETALLTSLLPCSYALCVCLNNREFAITLFLQAFYYHCPIGWWS